MNAVATTFTWHELSWVFMGCSGEDYLHARSSASKYQGAVDCYRDDMIQQLFRGLPTTLWNQYCDKFLHIVRLEWVLYNSKEPIP